MTPGDPERVVDPQWVSTHLHVSREYVYYLIATGDLAARKIGRRWRIRREDVDALLNERAS